MPGRIVVATGLPGALVANFGNRCTLVCAATLLRFAGATEPGPLLAKQIGRITGFNPTTGPPALAYVAVFGARPLLDIAIERVAAHAGIAVLSKTRLLPPPSTIVRSLDAGQPVVLNVIRAPSGAWSHSVIAYGYRYHRRGPIDLLVADPNQPTTIGVWRPLATPWRLGIVTATFVSFAGQ